MVSAEAPIIDGSGATILTAPFDADRRCLGRRHDAVLNGVAIYYSLRFGLRCVRSQSVKDCGVRRHHAERPLQR